MHQIVQVQLKQQLRGGLLPLFLRPDAPLALELSYANSNRQGRERSDRR